MSVPPLNPSPRAPVDTHQRWSIHRILQVANPGPLDWNRYELPIPNLPASLNGLRIVHLTDVHLRRRWWRAFDLLHRKLKQNPPDLILITGDLLDRGNAPPKILSNLKRFLTGLTARLGVWSILGNHDGNLLATALVRIGHNIIDGRIARLSDERSGTSIELVGIPGIWRGDLVDDGFFKQIPPRAENALRIILSHYPDAIRDFDSLKPDLVLSGHTHGGQICLPNGYPPLTHDGLPHSMAKGVFRWNDQSWLVVNRGLGYGSPAIRIFCPTEAIELTLRCPA